MEKVIGLGLVLVYATWFLTAQSTSLPTSVVDSSSVESFVDEKSIVNKTLTHKQLYKTIKSVGEDENWIMTDFKSNTLIAEKINDTTSISVTIKFDESSFHISPENNELQNAINKALHI